MPQGVCYCVLIRKVLRPERASIDKRYSINRETHGKVRMEKLTASEYNSQKHKQLHKTQKT